jgi:hypothetical protein
MRPFARGRWGLAGLLVGIAFFAEVQGPVTEPYPFATTSYPAGTPADEIDVAWRDVPVGLLPPAELAGSLRFDVDAGSPLGPNVLRTTSLVPDDWWVIDLPLQATAAPGRDVRIVVLDPATTVEGIVVAAPSGDGFGAEPRGAVAVPAAAADLVARAAAADAVVTLVSATGE